MVCVVSFPLGSAFFGQDLIAIFGNFGKVISTSIAKDDFDESKGFGVIKVG